MNSTLLTLSNTTNPTAPKFLKTIFITLLMVIGSLGMKAQVSAYIPDQLQLASYTDLPVATKTNIHSGVWNDAVTSIPIGFTFLFNGTNYTTTNVSSNGFITFGATAPTTGNYSPLSSAEGYSGAIAGYGRDLLVSAAAGSPQANTVSYELSGAAGSQILKIEYRAVKRLAADSGNISFQIWLYETTNVIEIRYAAQTSPFSANVTGQMGLRGAGAADFNNFGWGTVANWPALPAMTEIPAYGGTNIVTTTVGIRSAANRITAASNRLFRFTPVNCVAPTLVTASNVAASTADITWTAPSTPPSGGYQYFLQVGPTPVPTAATTPTGTSLTNALNLTGLASNTNYCIWVRSDCGTTSAWSVSDCFTTLCTAVNIPYFLYFDTGFTIPALPPCTSNLNIGTGNNWVTSNVVDEGFGGMSPDEYLVYNASGTQPANVWFFTRGLNVVAGNTYRLSYLYGGSTNFSFITNQMEVAIGSAPTNAAMTTQLADHTNIKASPIYNVINFTAASTGVIYVGFRAHSIANQGKVFLDEIEVVPSICIRPTAPTISLIGYNSAVATWSIPSPAPASGYAYYIQPSPSAAPTSTTTPTGFTAAGVNSVTLSGLNGNTNYCVWVRGNCGSPDDSEWSLSTCFTTTNTPPYCTPSSSGNASYINNFTTTNAVVNVNNSSGWSSPGYILYPLTVTEAQGGTLNFSITLSGPTVGAAIWVDWNGDGIFQASERMFNTTSYQTGPITGSFIVPNSPISSLGVTRMRVMIDYWSTNPSNPCLAMTRGEVEDYNFNVVVPPPPLTIGLTQSTQCAGTASPSIALTTPAGNFDVYSWSPNTGVTGGPTGPWTITSGSTITYTLTGTQTTAPFSTNTATYTFFALPLPTPITITPANSGTACQQGPAIALVATGGVVSGVPVSSDNFNTGAPGWTVEYCGNPPSNTACASDYMNAKFTLRPNNYNPAGPSWGSTIISSNDASTFFFANGDVQMPGNPNDTKLVSPIFDLTGYTAASLSFWHFYRQWTTSTGKVEISTNGGTSYTTLNTYSSNQGTTTNWVQQIIDLNAYVGMANLRIRFNYQAVWGWAWGVDNFVISGSATSAITWTPAAGLYMDAAATIPYVAGTGAGTVYAMPLNTTLYTASASTPAPTVCTTTSTTNVTVTPIGNGTITPQTQSGVCGNPADIVLSGFTGTVTGWEWSTDPNFVAPPGTIISGATAATLTSAQIGTFAGTRYYRAVITNGSCTGYAPAPNSTNTAAVSVSYNSTTWNSPGAWSAGPPNSTTAAIFNFAYTGATNLSACSVTVNSGVNVSFNSGRTLTVQNTVTVLGTGTLTFNSSPTNAASLIQVNDASVNSGNILSKRTTTGMVMYDFTFWSSPVAGQTLLGLSPGTLGDKYFEWSTSIWNWNQVPPANIMTPGKGYIIRAPQGWPTTPTVYNATFTGVPNNGVINVPIVVAGANVLNMIGNPYPSAVNIDAFMIHPTNSNKVQGTIYLWTHNTPITNTQYTGSDYAVYNYLGGVGTGPATNSGVNNSTPTRWVASGQGFFIKGINTGGTAIFNNSMRAGAGLPAYSNAGFFRTNEEDSNTVELEKHRVWLELRNSETAYKQMLVGYVETATNERDRLFDGDFVDAGNPVALYSLSGEDKFTIQGRSMPFNDNDTVPIGFKAAAAGVYEIGLANFDGLFMSQDVYLEDTMLNVIHNLKSGSYSFTTLDGTFDTRFILRFTNETALGVGNPDMASNSVIVYKNAAGIHINTGNAIMKSIKIFDIRGTLVYETTDVNSNMKSISNLNAAEQVLLVQMTTEDDKVITRKIVY